MRIVLSLSLLALLAACGADGQPETPAPGLTVTGEAQLGITGKL